MFLMVWLRRVDTTAQVALIAASAVVIMASLGLIVAFVIWEAEAERYTSGIPPHQFARQLEGDLLEDYAGVYGVAHNSGDSLSATREALRKGADVIEIDVVRSGGELRAGHDSPLPFIGDRLFRGPRLDEVWELAREAEAVKLDLKESSRGYLEDVVAFLVARPSTTVIVATRDVASLAFLAERYPAAIRLLSVGDGGQLRGFQESQEQQALADGVTIRHSLMNEEVGRWFEERGLLVLAWTVNGAPRLNELVEMGVDAITTENLNILQLLGGQERGEGQLIRPSR